MYGKSNGSHPAHGQKESTGGANSMDKSWDSKKTKGFAAMKRAQRACKVKGAGKY